MKKVLLIILTIHLSFLGIAQHKQYQRVHEVGGGLGAYNYTGELAEYVNIKNTTPGINGFYRYNFKNEISVLRVNLGFGLLGADESRTNQPRRVERAGSFNGQLLELSGVYEYDFFNFRDIDNVYYMSPYLFAGVGASSFFTSNGNSVQFLSIPFGTGLKFRLKGGWNLGAELGARKNFTDELDGFDDESTTGSSIQTDWHYYTGINISFTFYDLICKEL